MAESPTFWADIRSLWITTDRPIRDIARECGVSEGAIRKRATKEAWGPRNAPARKRAIVQAAAAGTHLGTQPSDAIRSEANQDIEDMTLAANVGRAALRRCRDLLDEKDRMVPPRDIKAVTEAGRAALEMIRRARNLDEPSPPPPDPEAGVRIYIPANGRDT